MAIITKTYCMAPTTVERRKVFSQKSGISQSQLVDRFVARALDHVESNWRSPEEILEAYLPQIAQRAKEPPPRRALKIVPKRHTARRQR